MNAARGSAGAAPATGAAPHSPHTAPTDPGRDLVYGLSARSDVMWEGVSSATTRSRPIINARDEPHADAEKYRRLHVIVGDSTMSDTTTLLKVGAAHLVLRPPLTMTPPGPCCSRRRAHHVARGDAPVPGAT